MFFTRHSWASKRNLVHIERKHVSSIWLYPSKRGPNKRKLTQAIQQQLGYVRRNLKHITTLASTVCLRLLSSEQYRELLVIQELYRQQAIMFESESSSIAHRIVSISQPHVRPIVRGKKNARVEFGAKLSVSLVNGYSFLDDLSWEAYHEGKRMQDSVEKYKIVMDTILKPFWPTPFIAHVAIVPTATNAVFA